VLNGTPRVRVEASDMVTIPRAELDSLKAEVKRLRLEVGRSVAKARIAADPGPQGAPASEDRKRRGSKHAQAARPSDP